MISIIVVNKDYSNFIPQLFNSLSQQTYKNFEIIFIDYGSSNIKIVKSYLNNYNFKITSYYVKLRNSNEARNFGVQFSSGKYIIFVDLDAVLMPRCLERMREELIANNAAFAYSNFVVSINNREYYVYYEKFTPEMLKIKPPALLSLIDKRFFVGFDVNLVKLYDWDMFLTMYEQKNACGVWVNEYLFKHYVDYRNKRNLTFKQEHGEAVNVIKEKHRDFFENKNKVENKFVSRIEDKIEKVDNKREDGGESKVLFVTHSGFWGIYKAYKHFAKITNNRLEDLENRKQETIPLNCKILVCGGYSREMYALMERAKKKNIKIIFTWHSSLAQIDFCNEKTFLMKILELTNEQELIDLVMVFYESDVSIFNSNKVIYMSYAFDFSDFENVNINLTKNRNVGFFSLPHFRKNILVNLLAVKDINCKLYVNKMIFDKYKEIFDSFLNDYVVRELSTDEELYNCMREMKVGICNYFVETFCYNAFEFLALGVPVVGNRLVPACDFDNEYLREMLLVDNPCKVDIVKDKVERILSLDDVEYGLLSKACKDFARQTAERMNIKFKSDFMLACDKLLRKKVMIIAKKYYPPYGGGEVYMHECAVKLYENYNVRVICIEDADGNLFKQDKVLVLDGIEILQLKNGFQYGNIFLKNIEKYNPDVVITWGSLAPVVERECSKLGIPLVNFIHFLGFLFKNFDGNCEDKDLIVDKDYLDSLKRSYVISNSNYTQSVLLKYGIKSEIVYPVIDKKAVVKKGNKIGCINAEWGKGGSIFLDLVRRYPKEQFIAIYPLNIVRDIDKPLFEKYDNLEIIGFQEDITKFYEQIKLLCCFSLVDETFCRAALEAQSNGIPVLSSNRGNLVYINENKDLMILVESSFKNYEVEYDKEDLYEKFEKVNNNKDYYEFASNKALQVNEKYFGSMDRFVNLIDRIINRKELI